MEGIPNIGGVPSSPVNGPGPTGRVRDREARRENAKRFEDELERENDDPEAKAGEPGTKAGDQAPRREPHPPADEDSGNTLDVVA
jgi:hypothetical protein